MFYMYIKFSTGCEISKWFNATSWSFLVIFRLFHWSIQRWMNDDFMYIVGLAVSHTGRVKSKDRVCESALPWWGVLQSIPRVVVKHSRLGAAPPRQPRGGKVSFMYADFGASVTRAKKLSPSPTATLRFDPISSKFDLTRSSLTGTLITWQWSVVDRVVVAWPQSYRLNRD